MAILGRLCQGKHTLVWVHHCIAMWQTCQQSRHWVVWQGSCCVGQPAGLQGTDALSGGEVTATALGVSRVSSSAQHGLLGVSSQTPLLLCTPHMPSLLCSYSMSSECLWVSNKEGGHIGVQAGPCVCLIMSLGYERSQPASNNSRCSCFLPDTSKRLCNDLSQALMVFGTDGHAPCLWSLQQ